MSGVAFAVLNERWGDSVEITESGKAVLDDVVEVDYVDREDMDTRVLVTESELPHVVYGASATAQKIRLVELLRSSRVDPMLEQWGICDHFLACVALHPMTPEEVRRDLLKDEAPVVREAAEVSVKGSQQGKLDESSSTKAFIDTLAYAPWLSKGN